MGDSIKAYYDSLADQESEKQNLISKQRLKKLSKVIENINLNEIDEVKDCIRSLNMTATFNKIEWQQFEKIEKFINKFNI